MKKPTTYKCPMCEKDVSVNEIFLTQKPKEPTPKPIICLVCLVGLYHAIQKEGK